MTFGENCTRRADVTARRGAEGSAPRYRLRHDSLRRLQIIQAVFAQSRAIAALGCLMHIFQPDSQIFAVHDQLGQCNFKRVA